MMVNKKNIIVLLSALILFVWLIGSSVLLSTSSDGNVDLNQGLLERNQKIVADKNQAMSQLIAEGRYKCCTEKPCFRCFSKPGHQEEELVCDCLVDLMNGKHPCGECIGEILEGEGNPLLSEYFATAIAEKLGKQHLETLKQVIAEKYNIPVNEQI